MISVFIGLAVSLSIIFFARITHFDRDKSFFPTVLIIIASYYVLFSIMAGHSLAQELLVASVFVILAIIGAFKSLTIVGMAIAAHGVYDLFHALYLNSTVAPIWWPSFCAAVDLVLGFWVIYLSKSSGSRAVFT